MRKLRPFGALAVLVLFPLIASIHAHAQSLLYVYDVDPSHFPVIKAKFIGFDRTMKPLTGAKPDDFQVIENGEARAVQTVTCAEPKNVNLSAVLAIDVSTSMADAKPGFESNMDIAKAAAITWINTIQLDNSECAVTSFDDKNYLNIDFTHDRASLYSAITSLKPQGGTNYDAGFIDPPAGALVIARGGKNKRIIIFLTDGQAAGREASIIDEANNSNVTIYCVTLGLATPTILQNISMRTGGRYFSNVETRQDMERVYRSILQLAQNPDGCQISWTSTSSCDVNRAVTITHLSDGARATTGFTAPPASIPSLGIDIPQVAFGATAPGTTRDTVITVTARTTPLRITNIVSGNPRVTIAATAGAAFPADLRLGESKQFTLHYAPADSTPQFARVEFTTDPPLCAESFIYASGGYPWVHPTRRTLAITSPNGGEQLLAGEVTSIVWKGNRPEDTVHLDYSNDNGSTWHAIDDGRTGRSWKWKVPATPSTQCLARVTHTRGNDTLHTLRSGLGPINTAYFAPDGIRVVVAGSNVGGEIWDGTNGSFLRTAFDSKSPITAMAVDYRDGRIMTAATDHIARIWSMECDSALLTLRGHSRNIVSADFSPGGTRLATGSADSTVRIWSMRTGQCLLTIPAHNGTVYGVAFGPSGERLASYGSDARIKIWNVATGALLNTITPPQSLSTVGLRSLAYSPDGKLILAGLTDGTARIWDAQSGALSRTLPGHQGTVHDACFTPDSKRAITGGPDGTVRVWDASTGVLLRTMRGHNQAVMRVAVNPYDGRILSASSDGTAKIWEEDTAADRDASDRVWTIVQPKLEVTASTLDFGTVEMGSSHDTTVTVMVRNLDADPLVIDKVRMHGDDAEAFEVVEGNAPISLAPGGTGAMRLRFTPKHIGASTAVLDFARTGAGPLASATLHGIGVVRTTPAIEAVKAITFAPLSCRETFTDAVFEIRNTGGAPLTIGDASFSGAGKDRFSIFPAFSSITVGPGDVGKLVVRFAPVDTDVGEIAAELAIQSNAANNPTLVVELQGRRERVAFTASAQTIDLGTVCPNQSASATITVTNTGSIGTSIRGSVGAPFATDGASWSITAGTERTVVVHFDGMTTGGEHRGELVLVDSICGIGLSIPVRVRVSPAALEADPVHIVATVGGSADAVLNLHNHSDRDITITSSTLADARFTVVAPALPLVIASGGSAAVTVRFAPSDTGAAAAAIALVGDPCSFAATLPLTGVGVPVGTSVELPVIEAAPGDHIRAPLRLVVAKTSLFTASHKFTATIRFNASLLEPAPGMPRGIIRDGERIITISGERDAGTDVLADLDLIAALGNADSTIIHIDDFVWTDVGSHVATRDGLFRLRGICRANGARLVTVGAQAALKESYPNPAQSSTTIEFETGEIGQTRLFVIDQLGKPVATVAAGEMAPGVHSATVDLTGLPSGIYFYVLQTPSERLSRRLDVRK